MRNSWGGTEADLILTDPPYNVDVTGGTKDALKIKNDSMPESEFYNFLLSAFKCMHDNLTDDGSIYVFHADAEGVNFRTAFTAAGFYLSAVCIWEKNKATLSWAPYHWKHEPVLYGWRHEPVLYGWREDGHHEYYGDRKQTTVWNFDAPTKSELHPTMKPIPLMAYPIKNSSLEGEIVLDPFLGSGSTLIACEETNRKCYGMELDPKYVDVEIQRFIEYTRQSDNISVERNGKILTYAELSEK